MVYTDGEMVWMWVNAVPYLVEASATRSIGKRNEGSK